MMIVKDQMNRLVEIKKFPPQKIVSLVPSISELLVEMGLWEELIGVTKFCIHPKELLKAKKIIGGTKNLNLDKIKSLQPDLIIGSKEENVKEQIERLWGECAVWMSNINTYEDAIEMIKQIGIITDKKNTSEKLIHDIEINYNCLQHQHHLFKNKRVVYLIWYKPYMAVAQNTYIDSMLQKAGIINAVTNFQRYVEITPEEILLLKPDYVLLSSEPYPFKEKHRRELQEILNKEIKIVFVNGEYFSWYGVKMKFLPEYVLSYRL